MLACCRWFPETGCLLSRIIVAGADPGLTGGVFATDGEVFVGRALEYTRDGDTPILTVSSLSEWLGDVVTTLGALPEKLFIERVYNFPTDSRRAAFTFGWVAGQLTGFFEAMDYLVSNPFPHRRMQLVPPKVWQNATLKPFIEVTEGEDRSSRKKALKQASVAYMADKFPGVNLLATKRSKVPHSGMADAAVLAHWGFTQERKLHDSFDT